MLRGQVAIFLSCSERFKPELAWPVRDALTGEGLCTVILSDAPPLPGAPDDPEAKAEPYLDASSAFVALCTADYELSDGSKYPKASIIDEIQQARTRPHLRDRSQVLRSPGVLLPSDITPTYNSLDVTKPVAAADIILGQLQLWGIVAVSPPAAPHPVGTEATDDVNVLFPGLESGDHAEARRRVYPLLRDRGEDRRRRIAAELHRKTMEPDDARTVVAASLLRAVAGLDARLVGGEMIEALAAYPGYPARACAANLLLDRAVLAPLEIPLEVLGRLAMPSVEDWFVWAPAMAAIQELVLHRRDAYAILDALAADGDARDRYAVADALLTVASVRPAAVAQDLARRLAEDPDPLIAAKAREVLAAVEPVTDADRARCYGHFGEPAAPAAEGRPQEAGSHGI
jgi:hypothetical protein